MIEAGSPDLHELVITVSQIINPSTARGAWAHYPNVCEQTHFDRRDI